jgi:hypothetical protein
MQRARADEVSFLAAEVLPAKGAGFSSVYTALLMN